jgi:GNAT superfamily N-acetyltransferase
MRAVPEPLVRPLSSDDMRAAVATLARAFIADPVTSFIIPKEARRAEHLRRLFGVFCSVQLRNGEVLGADGTAAVALLAPPCRWKVPTADIARNAHHIVRIFGTKTVRQLGLLTALEKHHPTAPHWYLEFLASDPARRGQGLASALIGTMLQRCDDEGLPAYLENSNDANLAFCRRHGFEVTGTFEIPHGGPRMWFMWREPRPS